MVVKRGQVKKKGSREDWPSVVSKREYFRYFIVRVIEANCIITFETMRFTICNVGMRQKEFVIFFVPLEHVTHSVKCQ